MTPTTLTMQGDVTLSPTLGNANGVPTVVASLGASLNLSARQESDVTITDDALYDLAFGGVVNADFVILTVTGGPPVEVQLTSAKGAAQKLPLATQLMIVSPGAPITGIAILRTPSQETTISYVLGEQA